MKAIPDDICGICYHPKQDADKCRHPDCDVCKKCKITRTVCDEAARPVDGLVMRAEIRNTRGPTDEYESYLVLRSGDKTWPYIHIPETLPDDVLEAALAKLNA